MPGFLIISKWFEISRLVVLNNNIINYILTRIIDTKPRITQTICIGVKLSLNINIHIANANTPLATEKIIAHLPSHAQFLRANNRKVLQIR